MEFFKVVKIAVFMSLFFCYSVFEVKASGPLSAYLRPEATTDNSRR